MPRSPLMSAFRRPIAALCLMLIAGFLSPAGCTQSRTSDKDLAFVDPAAGEQLVRESHAGVLGLGEAKAGIWVDCRPEKDFVERHIPGAVSMPYEMVTERHQELSSYGAIIVYGDTYNDSRAHGMTKRLIELGHGNVHTLRGGLNAWMKAERPVEGTKALEPPRR